jgi:DNA-binding winged helix-turn-helix (wHTH) protein/tetratricopeptide (TPR) repeat protein
MSLENSSDFLLNFSVQDVNGEDKHSYRFKSFRLDVAERQLTNDGTPVPLMPKVFDVLALLVARHGHLVEKSELLNTVWADTFIEEANIPRIIHDLRRVLGEDKNGNKYIETVAKKGYRFVAEVTERSESPTAATALSAPPAVAGGSAVVNNAFSLTEKPPATAGGADLIPKTRLILFAIGFLTAVFLLLMLSFNFRSDLPTSHKAKSIAVLPVNPVNAANRDDIYEVGIADSLITRLGAMKGLVVRPLGATRQYADINQDPIAAGKELKTDYVLASNYQIADGKIRITAQLFNVATGQIEEAYKSEKEAGNIFAFQDTIAADIGKLLQTRFALNPNNTTARRGTTNEEAYRLYLQGRNLTVKRNNESHKKAIEYFEQAIRLDPNYALAYARMAHAFYSSGLPENNAANAEKAKQIVNKALELDPNAAEAYVSRGYITMLYDWDLSAAERDFLRAIELEPNNDGAHWLYALILTYRQRFDEGLAEIETAISIDPGAPVYMTHRGRILYYARRYDEAITQYQQSADLDDRAAMPYAWLVRLYETKGDYASAYQSFLKREERSPRKDQIEIYQKAYETAGWRGLKEKETQLATNRFFDLANLLALQGEKDAAFENLNKAVERRDWRIITLTVEPSFDNLRDDPRFDELLRRVGLK